MMKRADHFSALRAVGLLLLTLALLATAACTPTSTPEAPTPDPAETQWLNMNTDYPVPSAPPPGLPAEEGKPVKVILLLGQSNATGSSICAYLKDNIGEEAYAVYEKGFESVRINYCLDAVISLASMASNVYVQELSDNQNEVKATISTGVSINHVITIFIALFGGWIWQTLGIETLFIASAVLGLCNSAYAATIKPKKTAA